MLYWHNNLKCCHLVVALGTLPCLMLIMADHTRLSDNVLSSLKPSMYSQAPISTSSTPHYPSTPLKHEDYNHDRTENIAFRHSKVTLKPKNTFKYSQPYPNKTVHPVSTILVETRSQPVNLIFRSTSGSVNVMQDHKRAKNFIRYMNSQEEPILMVLNITKPVVQEVREVILPIRNIKQEIHPVKEYIETIIKDAPESYNHENVKLEEKDYISNTKQEPPERSNQAAIENFEQMHKLKSYVTYLHGQSEDMHAKKYQTKGQGRDGHHGPVSTVVEHHLSDLGDMQDKVHDITEPNSLQIPFNLHNELDFDIHPKRHHKSIPSEEFKTDDFESDVSLEPIYRESKTSFQQSRLDKVTNKKENAHNSSMSLGEQNRIYGNLTGLIK